MLLSVGRGLLLVIVLAALNLGLWAPTSRADGVNPAVDGFRSCLLGQQKGSLLLLIDESGSLENTDPDAARVTSAEYFVDGLARYAKNNRLDLALSVASFSDDFHSTLGWTGLDAAGVDKVRAALESLRDRNDGVQTDYWNGLNGARKSLSERAEGDGTRCQALVWFSDGGFSVTLTQKEWEENPAARDKVYAPGLDLRKDAAEAEVLAQQDLCRPGGLADQVRIGGIAVFAIGLSSPKGASGSDFDSMKSIATGAEGCGQRTDPPGSFTEAGNIDELLVAFNSGEPPVPVPTCSAEPGKIEKCRSVQGSFVLDDSITSVHILASADLPGVEVWLLYPEDAEVEPVKLDAAVGDVGKLTPRGSTYTRVTDKSTSLDLAKSTRADDPWVGQWAVVFRVDPGVDAKAKVSITISGGLAPTWPARERTDLRTGDKARVVFGLVNEDGKPTASADLEGTGHLTAELVKPDGAVQPIGSTTGLQEISTKEFDLDLTGAPVGRAELKLQLDLTTAEFKGVPGTKLLPTTVRLPVDILPALGMPVLRPPIAFGRLVGADDLTAHSTLGLTGPGCVWLADGAPLDVRASPQSLGTVKIGSPSNGAEQCVRVEEGQTAELSLDLGVDHGGNGTLAGTVEITVSPLDQPDRAAAVQVPFSADLLRPFKKANFVVALIALILLGPGIPLLLLALVKRVTAKIPGRPLLAREIQVTVSGGDVLRDGAPLAIRDTDFRDLVSLKNKGSRTAEIPGAVLRTRTGWSPFGAGFVEAEMPGRVGLSSAFPRPYGKSQAARLPLAVHNTWLASRGQADLPGTATIVLLAAIDAEGDRRQALVDDVKARLPGLMPLLGDAGGATGTPPDPFGGGAAFGGPAPDVFGFGGTDAATSDSSGSWPPAAPPPAAGPADSPATSIWDSSGTSPAGPQPQPFSPPPVPPTEQQSPVWSFDSSFDNQDSGPPEH